jgi:hypothetical protein
MGMLTLMARSVNSHMCQATHATRKKKMSLTRMEGRLGLMKMMNPCQAGLHQQGQPHQGQGCLLLKKLAKDLVSRGPSPHALLLPDLSLSLRGQQGQFSSQGQLHLARLLPKGLNLLSQLL